MKKQAAQHELSEDVWAQLQNLTLRPWKHIPVTFITN